MIKFTDVGKTYVSKSKSKVEALKGVSFELGSNGMTFILGKSGSGKSTLLNLLGGLDRPTFGSIQVDGADMQSFTQTDYESYRNSYVGFVFQEYNLLDDFNVKDNVALALRLSKDVNVEQKVIEALKQVELNEEYLTRRVGELSGGEKQRVAIARAIVKNSKMILADEPTGNLDSETGESIWNILKNLSSTRPVIIVSHDRESAEKYADRTIEISDGRIISDNGIKQEEHPTESFTAVKQRLSFPVLLKMGFNSLFKRKAKTISIILVSMFTVCALLVSQLILTFLPERGIAKHIRLYDVPYVSVGQAHEDQFGHIRGHDIIRLSTKRYIQQNAETLEWSYAESKQQLLDFGLEFVGEALELDERSFYLTEDALLEKKKGWDHNDAVMLDGEEVLLSESSLSATELIGKQVRLYMGFHSGPTRFNYEEFYTLAGIIKKTIVDLPYFFAMEEFEGREGSSIQLNTLPRKEATVEIDGKQVSDEFNISYISRVNLYLTENGVEELRWNDKRELQDNEVFLTFGMWVLLGGEKESAYLKRESGYGQYSVLKMPEIVGKTVPIKLYDYETGDLLVDYGECKVKGILVGSDNAANVLFSDSNLKKADRKLNNNSIIVKVDSVKDIHRYLVNLRTGYEGEVTDVGMIGFLDGSSPMPTHSAMYGVENLYEYKVIVASICAAMAAVTVLLVISLISFSIKARKKEIGILSALGASSWDITKIFLLETLVFSSVIFVLGLAGIFSLIAIFNNGLSSLLALEYTLTIFVADIYTFVTLFGVCFVLLPLFALLPAIRIAKLKPIDAIRVL